ncbi:hypothetical protein QYE76_035813 [Lolium multiflorum]|uniref:Uncharacterized protein n=1 Tax=Lolium multiflorum TaxID=4521 RepID=A0AAD8VPC8_LOLMU|nr:hypothetical protein QYE76_035813 [Lolium multiflorum]
MAWLATSMTAGVELDFAIADDVLRKGTIKFVLHLAPLDDCLHPDAPLDEALLLDHAPETEVACTAGFIIDAGDSAWKNTRDRGSPRGNEWMEMNQGSIACGTLEPSATSGGVLIFVEDVAELLLCVVVSEEEDDDALLLSFNAKRYSGLGWLPTWVGLATWVATGLQWHARS